MLYVLCWTLERMRSNNSSAGSSVESWGTSRPEKARARSEGVSASTCRRAADSRASSWSASDSSEGLNRNQSVRRAHHTH
jgi:hypothetical protein